MTSAVGPFAAERTTGAGARAKDKKEDLEQDLAEAMAAKAAEIKLVIDGVEAVASPKMTILDVAEKHGIAIPTLCHVHGLVPFGGCRLCVVEIEGAGRLTAACHTPAATGMVIRTHSPKVLRARRVILELLIAGHTGPCVTDTGARSCALHQMAADVELGPPRFAVHKPRHSPVEDVSPYVRRDLSRCILCNRCVQVCSEIAGAGLLSLAYRSSHMKVVVDCDTVLNHDVCRDCGICIDYCPTTALYLPGCLGQEKTVRHRVEPADLRPYTSRSATQGELLVRLQAAQQQHGYLSTHVIGEIASALELPVSEVYSVASFYSFLSVLPLGRHVIRVCRSLPCCMKDVETIVESIRQEVGIAPGERTADGRFSLELTNCIGACDLAPAMLVNEDMHGNLTPEKIANVLADYK
jgi:NADH:ubiquinone oxidoreductase subunit E/NAD-dependent dihydropyrimidine dehydrogenase PreA subunit/ferredoxin